ncbi:50S ribosomal protein L25 [Candidatus Saccharibacteria bacterium]|nr:50S ribosomal protein L25 [Candidatus Saccharibacteria bacterium]
MNDIKLKLTKRTVEGKKVAKLRDQGYVPSVVYGGHDEASLTQSSLVETTKVIREAGKHSPVHLTIDGAKKLAIVKAVDLDPVKHVIRHIAFHTIKQSDVITTEVPIVLVGQGESPAERAGLVILQAIDSIEIKAKPAHLPESLQLSIAEIATEDDTLTIADLELPEGVAFADVDQDMDLVIANVYEPSALAAENEAAGGAASADDASAVASEEGSAEASDTEVTKTEAENK